jgi:hypothetical protein
MQDFRNLKVWQKAHVLTPDVYRKTRGFQADAFERTLRGINQKHSG